MACASCSQTLPEGARFCPFCGLQVAAIASEERRLVTVLFADIVGYTGLVEYLDPERAKRLLDDAFERLIGDIVEFGGTIDKVLGDGVLALFGAPVAHEDDPDRAIRAALQMHQSLATFVEEHGELTKPVQLRVGVNTGEVLFGRIGGTEDFTVMGDVVNVAARLEKLAPPGGIYVGDSTAALTSEAVVLEPVDDLDVRGREQSEMVWRVAGRGRSVLRAASTTPFVGRAAEFRLLGETIDRAVAGQSAVVAIAGEAGSGKTRLVGEALDQVRGEIAVLASACAPYGETNVWNPIATAMFGRVDPATSASADRIHDLSLEKAVTQYGFHSEDPTVGWLVEGALHIAGHQSAFDDMPVAQARETLFRLIVEALRRRSAIAPLILCIDDLQWADDLLIDLLHRITRSLADRPFLLVTAQRNDARIEWPPADSPADIVEIELEPLSPTEAAELVASVAGATTDQVLTDELYARSGGNPLFLTELAGLAGSGSGRNELPSSLRVLIAARLDRLSSPARAIIDNAAVLGSDGVLVSLQTFASELGQDFSLEALTDLDDNGLLEVSSDGSWRFLSDVVREVAYQTLTKVARAERHAGVAQVMSATPGVPIVSRAHHAASAAELNREIGPLTTVPADIADRAVSLLCRAARRSLDIGAFHRARDHVERALALEPSDPAVYRELLLLRASAAIELREFDMAGDDAAAALELAVEHADRFSEGTARRLIGVRAHGIGDLAVAHCELDASIAIFRELDEPTELAISLADRGFSEIFGGSLEKADRLLDESHELAKRLHDRRASAWALEHKALVAFLSGDTELAAARLETATAQFEELGDRAGTAWAQALKAYLAFNERRFDDAETLAKEARAEGLKLGERWGPAMMDSLLASIRLWTGNFDEALKLSERALTNFRERGDRFGIVQSLAPYVRSLVALGRHHEAERGIEEAMSLSESSGRLAFPVMIAAGTAVHLGLGDRSLVICEQALDRIEEMGANGSEVRTALSLALCQVGRAEDALAHLLAVDLDMPYASAVRALAHSLISDHDEALAQAALVTAEDGATYLDRVIASIAATAAEIALGRQDEAQARLSRATELAETAGDAVAIALTSHAAHLLVDAPATALPLGEGWRCVLRGLAEQSDGATESR